MVCSFNKRIILSITLSFIIILFIFTFIIKADGIGDLLGGDESTNTDNVLKHLSPNQDLYRDGDHFKLVNYFNEVNYLSNGVYIPYNLSVKNTNKSEYNYELDTGGVPFKIYIKSNSNTAGAVRFEKDGYFFTYDLSGGAMQWAEQPGFPTRTDTLGGGCPSNSQDSSVSINSNEFSYDGAYYNTSVKYAVYKDMLKETFVLGGLPSYKSYLYLEYTGNIKFNSSLQICDDIKCYIPSGTQDDFSTYGKIYFKDMDNNTIFYLKEPTVQDSAGNQINAFYKVKGSNAQMQFSLRINKTFLQNAVYPIYIDPTVSYNFSSTFQGINMFAQSATSCTSVPPTTGPIPTDCGTLTDRTSNSALDASDNVDLTLTGASSKYAMAIFYANLSGINNKDITLLNWTYEGSRDAGTLGLYWWNASNLSWVRFSTLNSASDLTISNYTSTINDFINSSNYTHLLVEDTVAADSFTTDFVKLEITYDSLIVNTPINNQEILNTLSTTLNTSQGGYNQTLWYTYNSGIKNYTLCTDSLECQTTITFPRQGFYNLSVYANKSDGTTTSQNVNNLFVGNQTIQEDANYNYTSGLWIRNSSVVDGNWITNGTCNAGTCYFYFNYTYIGNLNRAIWEVKDGQSQTNLSIPPQCITNNYLNLSATITNLNSQQHWYCNNFSSNTYLSLKDTSSATQNIIFEEHIIWLSYSNISTQSPIVTNTLSNTSNFSISSVNFTANISDDNDYLNSVSLYIDNVLNSTFSTPTINTTINNTFQFNVTGISEGLHTWFVSATDSDNLQTNSSAFTFRIDTTAPNLNIVFPVDYQTFDSKTILINYTVGDAGVGLSYCWWSNSSGILNNSVTCGNNFSVGEAGDGSYKVYLWANDTFNHISSTYVDYIISTTNPIVNLDYPSNGYWLNYNNLIFNFSFLDVHANSECQLWENWTSSWNKNQTIYGVSNNSIETNFSIVTLLDGYYKWNVWCNESNGLVGINAINWTFGVDTVYPQLKLSKPQNISYTINQLSLNYSVSDTNLKTCKYTINSGSSNITLTNCNNISITASQGSTTLKIYANDSANNVNSTSVTYFVDSIIPYISILSPPNSSYFNYNTSIEINITTSDTNLNTCWYNDNGGSNTIFTCGDNLSLGLSEGLHTINVSVNDSLNNLNNSYISIIPDVTFPIINITAITVVADSKAPTFSNTITDTNLNTCKYAIFNSLGGYEVSNTSFTCNSNTVTLVSAFSTYNLTVWAIDKAGNENSSTKSFTTYESSSPPGGGGGGPPTFIIASNLTEHCGNGICEDGKNNRSNLGEDFYSCSKDCGANIDLLLSSCFSSNAEERENCIIFSSEGALYVILGFIIIVLILLSLFRVRKKKKLSYFTKEEKKK